MLEIRELHKVYNNDCHALKGVTFDVKPSEFLVVIGLSGSGKSTLLRCINRLHEPSTGSIKFNGKEITHLRGLALRKIRSQIGMIFQHFNLDPNKTVLTNVFKGTIFKKILFKMF